MITILYTDEYLTIVDKPNGMLVHQSSIASDDDPTVLQLLRVQTGRMLYPVHRIDRPTSGVLVFAHSSDIARNLQEILASPESSKRYVALIRGWMPEGLVCSRDVKNDKGVAKRAETKFVPLEFFELALATDRYATARFSIVEAYISTGRWHQIRQHLAQLRHYIINDRVHGDGKQNKLFTQQLGITNMFLHARAICFTHPVSGKTLEIEAEFPRHWTIFREMASLKSVDHLQG